MKTASEVNIQLFGWLEQGLSKSEIVARLAEACLGWPYVWGAYGQKCTPSHRKAYAARSACPAGEAEQIRKKCPVCSGKQSACSGCRYYPGGPVLDFDCRGFTRWILGQVGISLAGAGATSQWNSSSNWAQKGLIADMPPGQVCCLFMKNGRKMSHTGLHVGGGQVIHCSGEVKRGKITDRGWTHFAVPKALAGEVQMPTPSTTKPTLRKGSKGEYVTLLQTQLIQQGYSCGTAGADGIYGSATVAVVRRFQLDHGLQMDGIVGSATYAALENPQPMPTYTVHIPGQPKYAAEALVKQYTGAWMTEEGKE